jgi:hypothetical protein
MKFSRVFSILHLVFELNTYFVHLVSLQTLIGRFERGLWQCHKYFLLIDFVL